MPATREDLVKIARQAAGGLNRPPADCEGEYTVPAGMALTAGETITVRIACEHTVRNPAAYDPPEWVLDAIRAAYERGRRDGHQEQSDAMLGAAAFLGVPFSAPRKPEGG